MRVGQAWPRLPISYNETTAHDSNGNISSRLSLGGMLGAFEPFWASEMPFEARFLLLGAFLGLAGAIFAARSGVRPYGRLSAV